MEQPDDLNSQVITLKTTDTHNKVDYDLKITLGVLKRDSDQAITATPEALFQDNCLVVGTVGSGKTWTISRLLEECLRFNSRLILFDLNDEFSGIESDTCLTLSCADASIPFEQLNIAEILELLSFKDETQKAIFLEILSALQQNNSVSNSNNMGLGNTFSEILDLINGILESEEVTNEAIAVRNHVLTKIYEGVFIPFIPTNDKASVVDEIKSFLLKNSAKKLIRLSFRNIPSDGSSSRVFINFITRYLRKLYTNPDSGSLTSSVMIIDDAEMAIANPSSNLNAVRDLFDKASPKNLRCCLSVSTPLDIPFSMLKNTGSFIIHRLKLPQEIDYISQTASLIGEQDKATIPLFISGDALLLNARLYAPYLIRVAHPEYKPSGKEGLFQNSWR